MTTESTADRAALTNQEKIKAFIDATMKRLGFFDEPACPQQELAEAAFLAKLENAERLAPRHPGTPRAAATTIIFTGATFLRADLKPGGQPYFVERGMDRKTLYAATRARPRGKREGGPGRPERGYAFPAGVAQEWIGMLMDDWVAEKSAGDAIAGQPPLRLLTVPRSTPLKAWRGLNRAAS